MSQEVLKETRKRMEKVEADLRSELATLRTGRASISLLDHVRVDAYGAPTPIREVGKITIGDPTTLLVQPWDASLLPHIEKAIRAADLGLNPANDGKIIRVPIPVLTDERRKEMVKHLHKVLENRRTAVRNIRRDMNESFKKLLKEKKMSEDEERRGLEQAQKLTDEFIGKVDELGKNKEKEILG
jgi:ribosome recycling factor